MLTLLRRLTLSSLLTGALASGCATDPAAPPVTGGCTDTCASLGFNCGQALDTCGNIIECGTCTDGQTCGAAGPNQCAIGTCTELTCEGAAQTCGYLASRCGVVWDCGNGVACEGAGSGPGTGSGSGSGAGSSTGNGGGSSGSGGTGPVVCDWGTEFASSPSELGAGSQSPQGSTTQQYDPKQAVTRSGVNYKVLPNGWGPGWSNHNIAWNGTALTVTVNGSPGSNFEPASFPTTFCGNYSNESSGSCGLPASVSGTGAVMAGISWAAGGNTSDYNVTLDVWLGDGFNLSSYLMIWLRYPEGRRPAGYLMYDCATVEGQPGVWEIWAGVVNGHNIITYTRPQDMDISQIEVDIRAFYRDAMARPDKSGWKKLSGSQINSVAGGFEVWESVSNLQMTDFYVDVQ